MTSPKKFDAYIMRQDAKKVLHVGNFFLFRSGLSRVYAALSRFYHLSLFKMLTLHRCN